MENSQRDEAQKVALLRARLLETYSQSTDIDEGTITRFLRARSHNVDKALKFLLQHVKWTQAFKPLGYIQESEITKELKKEKIFSQGVDNSGRPIIVIWPARHFTSDRDVEEFKRLAVFGLDKATASLLGPLEKFVVIADLKGFGYRNIDVKGYLSCLQILQDHYPERLGKLYVLHIPLLFGGLWKILYPFMDPNVREKVIFVDDKQLTKTLLKDMDITQLPAEYGGMLPLVPIQHLMKAP